MLWMQHSDNSPNCLPKLNKSFTENLGNKSKKKEDNIYSQIQCEKRDFF